MKKRCSKHLHFMVFNFLKLYCEISQNITNKKLQPSDQILLIKILSKPINENVRIYLQTLNYELVEKTYRFNWQIEQQ